MRITNFCIILLTLTFNTVYSQTYEEIIKLREQYEQLKQSQIDESLANDGETLLKDEKIANPTRIIYKPEDLDEFYRTQLTQLSKSIDELKILNSYFDSTKSLTHFGYNIFTDRDTMSFFDNMPLPPNYSLGSGDELFISLWGEVEKEEKSIINRDGNIFLEDIGIISLGGITLKEAKLKIKNSYTKTYSTLKSNNPTTFVDVSLGNLNGININILGFVKSPGVYALHPFSDPLTALFYAGGIDTTGSLRNIKLFRNGNEIDSLDLYDIIHHGSKKHFRLLDQDIIFVPPRKSKVLINGEVLLPGFFELNNSESALDLIKYSGGLTSKASTISILKRINSPTKRKSDDEAIKYFSIPIDSMDNFIISNGDSLGIRSISDYHPTITINGWVKRPGQYPYIKGLSLLELIEIAGGLYDESWLLGSDNKTINISNYNNSGSTNTVELSYKKIINGDSKIYLSEFDEIQIAKRINNNFNKYITITGEVRSEGVYNISNRSIDQLINVAGGYTSNAFIEGIELYRDTLRVGLDDLSMIPINGDSLHIPYPTGSINILGSVNNPGPISFEKGLSINEYIKKVGGYTIYANKEDVFIVYANGIAKKKSRFNSPKVKEGSTIMVSASRLVTEQTNYLEVSQQVATIISSLATVALIINSQKN